MQNTTGKSGVPRAFASRPTGRHADPARFEELERRRLLALAAWAGHADVEPAGPVSPVSLVEWRGFDYKVQTGAWLIGFHEMTGGGDSAEQLGREAASALGATVRSVSAVGRYWVQLTTTTTITPSMVDVALARLPGIRSIEPDRLVESTRTPNDERYGEQYYHENTGTFLGSLGTIGADMDTPLAWDTTIGTRTQVVAVLDTGVQRTHPDLAANIYVNSGEIPGNGIDDDGNGFVDDVSGWDFWDNNNSPNDLDGHGTHVAGIIGAVGNNGIGIAGVNWSVSILPVRVLGPFGGSIASIVGGIDYVTMLRERGVNIAAINASYGAPGARLYEDTPEGFNAERDAIVRFIDQGGTFVAAAGNNNNDNDNEVFSFFPASYKIPGLISVASTDWEDRRSGFSNYGAETVDLGAPGDLILSTYVGNTYAYLSGTSMASPQVAGAVALLRSIKPNASAPEIRQALIDSVDPVADLQGRTVAGGRMNVARAVKVIGLTGPALTTVLPGPVTGQLDPTTNTPLKTLTVRFNRPIDAEKLSPAVVELRRDGADNQFDTPDDGLITVASVTRSETNPREVSISLNLNALPSQRLPIDRYRLTLIASVSPGVGITDLDGNFLNGNSVSGENERYFFNVVAISGTYEVNDTLATATPVVFSASGTATFTGVTLGDGIFAGLDVDIFRLELARGGQVTAEVIAKRLPTGSSLDSYLRLFNANGQELANNDQFYGQDSFIDYYVSTGGVYYVAVSGFGNSSYNATVGGSGTPQSTGLYSLRIQANLNTDDLVSAATNFEVPLRVPSIGTQGTVESSLQISDTRQILDVNVQVRLRHSFVSDVIMTLVSPSGTEVVLVNRRGGSGQDMTPTLFDDEAPQSIVTGSAPFAGSFRAEESLGRFDGQAAAGTWTLRIEDVAGLNSGELDGWRLDLRLENNIFGPFEPNDTLPNARDLTQISATGFGTATISAFLGDGGFGLMDRDFYKFSVAAGASMTAASISGADTALRLFTAQGTQLLLAADAGSTNARIENYVFNDSGTYYLAVSAGSNTAYDPFNVASGVAAASTGSYTLVVSMTDGVSDGSLALRGERLSMGLGTDGLLYSAGGGVGMRYDGIEFLYRQSAAAALPRTFFGAATDGTVFLNARQNQAPLQTSQLPFSLTDQSDSFNARGVAKALFNGNLRIERTVSMGKTDTFAAIDVLFTNQGTTSIASLSWMEGFNPEMGLNLDPESATTDNDIDASGRLATATFTNNQYQGGLTVGLAAPSADPRATAMVVSPSIVQSLRDPTQLLAITPTDPNGANTDFHLALVYDLGTVTPGETVALRYFVFFGDSKSSVEGLYGVLNAGTGSGHLTADPTSPADEVLADGSPVPQLPYRYYFPEGFATPSTNTFIPILNLNDQAARVVVIARYETGVRDQVIAEFAGESSIAANSRSGVTITSPFLFSTGSQLVRPYEGYAVEIRSDRPLAATFSHYDTNLTTTAASIGESFTTRVSTTWTVPEVAKGGSSRDFLLYYNTADTTSKVDFTFYPSGGGQTYTLTQVVEGNRRLGINLHDLSESQLPSGANGTRATYGVKVESQTPLVVVLSQYDLEAQTAEGATGLPNLGSTVGATSEGDLGLDATSERLAILNATPQSAEVSLVFLFGTGSSYRSVVTVGPASQRIVEVGSLPGFPVGQRYSMQFSSTRPVTVSLIADSFGDQLVSGVTDRAYRLWGFGEGFKPRDGNPLVTETLRLYNPNANDTIAEIILRYDAGLGTESRRVVVPARASFSIDLHEMVTGSRRTTEVWYGISVKSAAPIVASMTHADAFFPGAFSTLGTPLGDGVGI